MSYFSEVLSQVVASLAHNKLRSLLTMAGIAWGVACIVIIVAMGEGFKEGQRKNMKQIGENIALVFSGRTERQAGGQRAGRRIRLEYSDVRDIRTECHTVARVTAELSSQTTAASPHNSGSFQTFGVEPVFSLVRTVPLAEGRWLNASDEADARRVCFIGENVRKQLFGERSGAVGSQIAINGLPFQVIGRMPDKKQTSSYNGRDVDKIFVPYSTMVRDFPPKESSWYRGIVWDIVYQPRSTAEWKEAQQQVRRVLGRNHGFDPDDEAAVRIWDTIEDAQRVDSIFASMTAFLGTIAVVTLTLGGIGVMNIMLVSVTERTSEIGIRKAIGATRTRIMFDFLTEGVLLAGISGCVGWAAAYGLAAAVNSFPMPDMFGGLPVDGTTTALAFAALSVVAIGSALWPAWRAASLTPVEALRYER